MLGQEIRKKEAAKVIHDSVVKRFELEIERKKSLDKKANNLIGFIGIILSLVTGFGVIYLKMPKFVEWNFGYLIELSPLFSFITVCIALFLSTFFILRALQIKNYSYVPNAFNLIGEYEDSSENSVLQALYDEYAIAIKENTQENNKEARKIQKAVYCLSIGFLLLFIHVILSIFT